MTQDELKAKQARLNELETKTNDLRRAIDEGITAARAINAKVREAQIQLRPIEGEINNLRDEIKRHLAAEAEKAREEAKKKMIEAAEAKKKADEVKPASE